MITLKYFYDSAGVLWVYCPWCSAMVCEDKGRQMLLPFFDHKPTCEVG